MNNTFFEPIRCCENCRHVFWLPQNSAYFGLGECYEQLKARKQQGEALLLVSAGYGVACPHFEAIEENLIEKSGGGLADVLGVRKGADFPGTL